MYKIYDVTISYYKDIDKTETFSYQDVLNSSENIYETLFMKHSENYLVNNVEYEEVSFDGFSISIEKE